MSPFLQLLRASLLTAALIAPFPSSATPQPNAVTPDGGRYYGALVNGKLHGNGRLEWASGDRYEGRFAYGRFSGHGRMQWATGQRYEGEFRKGTMSGHGEMTLADGTVYVGDFRAGMFNGHGELRTPGGERYTGVPERPVRRKGALREGKWRRLHR